MSTASNFKMEDVIVLTRMSDTLSKMDGILELVTPTFISIFGQPDQNQVEKLSQIPEHNRYVIYKTLLLDEQNEMEIMFGFDFDSAEENQAPTLFTSIYCPENSPIGYGLLDIIHSDNSPFDYYDDDDMVLAWFEVPLITFITEQDQSYAISQWFIEKLLESKQVLNSISQLRA